MLLSTPKLPAEMRIVHLNDKYTTQQNNFAEVVLSKDERKALGKRKEKQQKTREKNDQRAFILDFKGDMSASQVGVLREEISAVLSMARPHQDSVVIRLESPGGLVHGYGLAAAQLARIRDANIELIVCVDKVAAGGGYMMACVANHIVAAPFAVLGSIGVVAQLPNFNKLLKRLDIDFDVYTAGEYKRTVTMFGENTAAGKDKFTEELNQTHQLFKHFVQKYRKQLDIAAVTTGEHWYAVDAQPLHLVDSIQTSDAYIVGLLDDKDVYAIYSRKKPTLVEKIGLQSAHLSSGLLAGVMHGVVNMLHRMDFEWLKAK